MDEKDWFEYYKFTHEKIKHCEDQYTWSIKVNQGAEIEIQVGGYSHKSLLKDTKEESYFDIILYNCDERDSYKNGVFSKRVIEGVSYKNSMRIINKVIENFS